MAKIFYTDKDIEEMHRKGVKSLRVTDEVALTDLAYEKAQRLGLQLVADVDAPPAAPVRPYLSDVKPRPSKPVVDSVPSASPQADSDIAKRIRAAVLGKLGDQVDAALVDNIIRRVIKATGLK